MKKLLLAEAASLQFESPTPRMAPRHEARIMVQSMKITFTFALRAITGIVFANTAVWAAQSPPPSPGASVFVQNCAFCHGRDAGGGEEGPDLTRSKLVARMLAVTKLGRWF